MIIQSSNDPIKIKFPESFDVTKFSKIRVTLWQSDEMLKLWEKEDLEQDVEKNMYIASLTQEETASYNDGRCLLEIKWLEEGNDKTWFAQQVYLIITDRNDKEVITND